MYLYLFLAVLIGLPALYGMLQVVRQGRKKSRQLRLAGAFDALVRQHKLSVECLDILEGRIIALDRKNKKLLLIDHTGKHRQECCISLFHVREVRIVEDQDPVHRCTHTLSVELACRRADTRYRFYFYRDGRDAVTELPSLSRKALHWHSRISLHRSPGIISLEQEFTG
ncbi:hypothetical protein V9K67_12790 [Paraflavisolibacter sp. H34]|uniref:hypothetical protein n=1 Tax=Huijunlia imazamoxiresistens TaxID=3127457 RepID=UPI0030165996